MNFGKPNLQPLGPMFQHLFNILMSMFYHLISKSWAKQQAKNAQSWPLEMSSMCCAKCMAHCLCIKHVLVIRRGRIFLSTQLYFSTETKQKKSKNGYYP
jgi:hypothetical protein